MQACVYVCMYVCMCMCIFDRELRWGFEGNLCADTFGFDLEGFEEEQTVPVLSKSRPVKI